MIQKAFVDESMGISQIEEWYRRFKNGRTSVDSDPRSGRPSLTTTPENIERVRLAIESDRRFTVRELENDLGITKTTVSEILNKILGMIRMCVKLIPKLLTTEQKDLRSEIAQDNLEMVSDDENVLKKVISSDESWVYVSCEFYVNLHDRFRLEVRILFYPMRTWKLAAWVTAIIAGMRVVGGTGEGVQVEGGAGAEPPDRHDMMLKCFMNKFCHETRHDLWR